MTAITPATSSDDDAEAPVAVMTPRRYILGSDDEEDDLDNLPSSLGDDEKLVFEPNSRDMLLLLFSLVSTTIFFCLISLQFRQTEQFEAKQSIRESINYAELLDVGSDADMWSWLSTFSESLVAFPTDESPSYTSIHDLRSSLRVKDHQVCHLGAHNRILGAVGISQTRHGVEAPRGRLDPISAFSSPRVTVGKQFASLNDSPPNTRIGSTNGDANVVTVCQRDTVTSACSAKSELFLQVAEGTEDLLASIAIHVNLFGAVLTDGDLHLGPSYLSGQLSHGDSTVELFDFRDILEGAADIYIGENSAVPEPATDEERDENCEVWCDNMSRCGTFFESTIRNITSCRQDCTENNLMYLATACQSDTKDKLFAKSVAGCQRGDLMDRCSLVQLSAPVSTTSFSSDGRGVVSLPQLTVSYSESGGLSGTLDLTDILARDDSLSVFVDEAFDPTQPLVLTLTMNYEGEAGDQSDTDSYVERSISTTDECPYYTLAGGVGWGALLEYADGSQTWNPQSDTLLLAPAQDNMCIPANERIGNATVAMMTPDLAGTNRITTNVGECVPSDPLISSCSSYFVTTHDEHLLACKQVLSDPKYADALIHQFGGSSIDSADLVANKILNCYDTMTQDSTMLHTWTPYSSQLDSFVFVFDCSEADGTPSSRTLASFLHLMLLKESGWVDGSTGQITLSFVASNLNQNLLAFVEITFTQSTVGVWQGSAKLFVTKKDEAVEGVELGLTVTFLIFITISFVSEILDWIRHCMDKQREQSLSNYFSDFLDLLRVGLAVALVAQRFTLADSVAELTSETKANLARFNIQDSDLFSSLLEPLIQAAKDLEADFNVFQVLCGLEIILFMFWVMKHFRHPRLAAVSKTVTETRGDMGHVLIVFVAMTLSFAILGSVFFGGDIKTFSSTDKSIEACLLILFGHFDYDAMLESDHFGAVIFFWGYLLLVFLILFNIVLAIVVNAYTKYQERLELYETKPNMFQDIPMLVKDKLKTKVL